MDNHIKRVLGSFVENQDGKVEGSKSITERKQVLKGEVRHTDKVKESKFMRQDLVFNEGSHPSSCWSIKGMSGTLHNVQTGNTDRSLLWRQWSPALDPPLLLF